MCLTCDHLGFRKEIRDLQKDPAYSWCGYLDLLHDHAKASEHVSERDRQHLADIRRRTEDPAFAAEYVRVESPDPLEEWEERQILRERRALLRWAESLGWPALGKPVPIVTKAGEHAGNSLPLQGEAPWRYAVTACRQPEEFRRLTVVLQRLEMTMRAESKTGDIVVTVPLSFGLDTWIAEGDAAGEPWTGTEWGFTTGGPLPDSQPGDRCYVVYNGRLRGYAPLLRVEQPAPGRLCFVRGGGAVAVTIPERITGFRGWRKRWWKREAEVPFPEWMQE